MHAVIAVKHDAAGCICWLKLHVLVLSIVGLRLFGISKRVLLHQMLAGTQQSH